MRTARTAAGNINHRGGQFACPGSFTARPVGRCSRITRRGTSDCRLFVPRAVCPFSPKTLVMGNRSQSIRIDSHRRIEVIISIRYNPRTDYRRTLILNRACVASLISFLFRFHFHSLSVCLHFKNQKIAHTKSLQPSPNYGFTFAATSSVAVESLGRCELN